MSKSIVAPSKDASWARLPRIGSITVLQVQFFDNRAEASGVKGKSDFTLKVFAWTSGWNINLKIPEWWRVIQLVEPQTFLRWARKKHKAGGMDAAMLATYETVAQQAIGFAQGDDFELVRLGHIGSPPGTQYFIGQFVLVAKRKDGSFTGFIFNNGEHALLEDLTPTKKAGRYRKPGTPTHAAIIKGMELLNRQREAEKQIAEREAQEPNKVRQEYPQVDPMFRGFMGGSAH